MCFALCQRMWLWQPSEPTFVSLFSHLISLCLSLCLSQIVIAKSPVAPFAVLNYTVQKEGIRLEGEWTDNLFLVVVLSLWPFHQARVMVNTMETAAGHADGLTVMKITFQPMGTDFIQRFFFVVNLIFTQCTKPVTLSCIQFIKRKSCFIVIWLI